MILFGLPLLWAALTILCLRDYARKRQEARTRPPLTEEEKAELAEARELIGRKALPSFRRPKEVLAFAAYTLFCLPFAIAFLPVLVLACLLPKPQPG